MRGGLNLKPKNLSIQKKDLGQFVEKVNASQIDWNSKDQNKGFSEENKSFYNNTEGGYNNNASAFNDANSKYNYSQNGYGQKNEYNPENQNWYELRILGKYPERRAYHTSFQVGKKMYIYGGHDIKEGSLGSLWMLDIGKLSEQSNSEFPEQSDKRASWTKVEFHGKESPGLIAHHTSVVFGEKMYTFGGSSTSNMKDQSHSFYSLDLKTYKWDQINARGDLPITRDDHSAVIYEGSMVIFGGFSTNGERSNDIYRYYFKDNKWEKVSALGLDAPEPRAGHSSLIFGDSMVIFGGRDVESNKLNDIWVFNFTTYQWESINITDDELKPLARSGHTACLYKDMMLIFGGVHEVTKELDDMMLFDFRNRRWIQFFEEFSSPVRIKRLQDSPTSSPSNNFGLVKQATNSFNNYGTSGFNTLSSPNRSTQKRFSIKKGQVLSQFSKNQQSKSLIRQSTTEGGYTRSSSSAVGPRKRNNRLQKINADKLKDQPLIELESPTSISMKNSFIIKNADPSFEAYYNSIKKKRSNAAQAAASILNQSVVTQVSEGPYGKVQGKRPAPRDGHSAIIYGDYCIIFGGDRHHMPFNDIFMLDLRKEFIMRSHIFH
eukprot:403373787